MALIDRAAHKSTIVLQVANFESTVAAVQSINVQCRRQHDYASYSVPAVQTSLDLGSLS